MNKKLLTLSFATLGLLVTSCAEVGPDFSDKIPHSSLIEKDTKHLDKVQVNDGRKFAEEVEDFIYPDIITIHYKNDAKDYDSKRLWIWSPNAAPETEFEFSPDYDLLPDGTPDTTSEPWSFSSTFYTADAFEGIKDPSFSFMIKSAGSWSWKSVEVPVEYKNFTPVEVTTGPDAGKLKLDLYAVQSGSRIDVFQTKADAMSDQIDTAFISNDFKKINIYTKDGTGDGVSLINDLKIYKFTETYAGLTPELQETLKKDYLLFQAKDINKQNVAVKFEKTLTVNCQYQIECDFKGEKEGKFTKAVVNYDNLYNTSSFQELNYKGDDLGARVSADKTKTTFKVWAPTAQSMILKVFDRGYDASFLPADKFTDPLEKSKCNTYVAYDMHLNLDTFVWEVTVPENLSGKYYTYQVCNTNGINNVVDPYAYSAGMKGRRGMVVDFDDPRAVPEGWNDETIPLDWSKNETLNIETSQQLAISEQHIRDLTMSDTWTGTERPGTFKAFIESGTTLEHNGKTVKTGFDHLREYGVNAIQLLPVFDYDNGERGTKKVALDPEKPEELTQVTDYDVNGEYNWGYNPLNYNCVEGGYSSDPNDGYARIKEFRELILKCATNKDLEGNAHPIRIIMDVVFNHVSSAPTSNFERLMPHYYYRFTKDGSYSDASGCGNEVRTEAPMMRKFIVDSTEMWATQYRVKGFRYDLMGAIDLQTLSDVADNLYGIDPTIVTYGEGWHAGAPAYPGNLIGVNQNIQRDLVPGRDDPNYTGKYKGRGYVGGFNNGGRDSLKGDNDIKNAGAFKGFIGGNGGQEYRAKIAMLGGNGNGDHPMHTLQNVNYVSCHDNYTLFDQLNWILSDGTNEPDIKMIANASSAVNGMILMSNAMSFILGGEEIFRTKIEDLEDPTPQDLTYETEMFGKRISHNSYKSSDKTNAYDYTRKAELYDYFENYVELVKLKQDLKYSQTYVDGAKLTAGEEASIETDNTGEHSIGVFRQGISGNYHVYLTSTYGRTFQTKGNVVFSTNPALIGGTNYKVDSKYTLTITKE